MRKQKFDENLRKLEFLVDEGARARNNFFSYIDLCEGHGINACPVQEEGMEIHFMHHLYLYSPNTRVY